ncbi:stalk domain-containing protein [Paenibacillus xanthanilyticus]|uniref:Stalk domain-containing protein n=1 Tax=Paenibacillus xanthanilyticus TaxID=1783531 RepID=A0ABV8K2G2_9BACL
MGIMLVICMLLSSAAAASAVAEATGKGITTIINGKVVQSDVEPVLQKGRVFVPIRALASLQLEFLWGERDKIATVLNRDGKSVVLRLNENRAHINGHEVNLDTPLFVVKGRVFVPLRFISEAFGFQVNYQAERAAVTINSPAPEQQEEAFSPGVFIDWESVQAPLLHDAIQENLQHVLEAMANQNQAAFKAAFIQETTPSAFLYLLENEYRFEDISTVMDDASGRIQVSIQGKVKHSDGEVNERQLAFYYMKDQEGEWKLASID